jgi:lysophospholipase L1-like esterase
MLECLIAGDSIAVGTKQFMPQCQLVGKGGINTWQFNKMYTNKELTADTVIISLGSNDHKYIETYDEMFAMRQRVAAKNVYWILPHGNLRASEVPIEKIQSIVNEIAQYYGDTVLPITRTQSDGIHPSWAGYKDIVEKAR